MVWSPAIRLYTSENTDNLVQRKPGNSFPSRKPFLDRSVNSKTPDTGKLKPKQNQSVVKENVTFEKQNKTSKNELDAEEFIFSFKEVYDDYNDIWPRLKKEKIVQILNNYCNNREDTPPPLLETVPEDINPMFIELPKIEEPQLDEDVWKKNFDVELPTCDDFDMSF